MANQNGQQMGGVGGRQGAWVPVNWNWKGHLQLCRRGRARGSLGSVTRGGSNKLDRVVGVDQVGGEGSGCCPRAGVIARQAVEGRCSQRERTISRRYRHHEGSARVSGGEQIARRGCTLKARNWGGGIVDRSVTSSRNPTQPNRAGGSGCYPRVREENVWRLGEKGGRPSTECLWQVVGRGFSGNGRMDTVAVERGKVGIARRAPAG